MRARRSATVLALAAAAWGAAAAPAWSYPVVAGHLDHAWANVYELNAAENTNRTWLGYSTGPTPSNANGTVSPIVPATGPTVNLLSARGANQLYTWSHPAATVGGSYDPATRTGTIDFTGGIRFEAPPFPAGHGFVITFENPRVVLDGASGQLFASGTQQEGKAYDRSQPVYDLDLSQATCADTSTQTTITGIVPRIATEGYVYPATYATGDGPERTPNTFGSFSLVVSATPLVGDGSGGTPKPCGAAAPAPTPSATPVATATATPQATPTVAPEPALVRVTRVRLSAHRLRFRLSRPARTRVFMTRGGRTVRSFVVPKRYRGVVVKLKGLERGRYQVTLTPRGGDSLSVARRVGHDRAVH